MKRIAFYFLYLLFYINVIGQNFPIGHRQFNFVDPSRNRTIQTEVYYPATSAGDNTPFASGQFPLLVFGHGFVMSWDSYQWLWDSIVPKGYIIAFPRTEGGMSPSHSAFGLDLKFLNNFILSEGSNPSSFFYQHILGTSAIMGHSMGGGASVLASASNTNLTTLINFAAAETNPSAISAASNVVVPTLMFYGTNDGVTPPSSHQIPIYNAISSSCKTLIGIIGGGHCYFANYNFNCSFGESTTNPQPTITREQQLSIVTQLLVPYLNFTLKNDPAAEQLFYHRLNTMNTITYQRSCLMNHDLALTRFLSPLNGCGLSSNQSIKVRIKNNGTNPASGFSVAYKFNNQQPVIEYFNGTIPANDSIEFTFSSTVNAGNSGATYSFMAYLIYQLDEYSYNDTIKVNYTNTSVPLPLSVDFTGFNGTNLSTVFPGWREAQGVVPTGTSSTWVNRTGVGGTNNVTAKVNYYGSPIREWILGPAFLCTQYTYLYFDVAVTAYNNSNPYTNGMGTYDSLRVFYSTDCGNTWKRLTSFGKNSGFTNSLQTKSISLAQFNGMGLAIAFQAFRETTSANDYDLHLDNIMIKNEHPYDLSVIQLVSPTIKTCYGNENVFVRIQNNGINTVDFSTEYATVQVLVNNGAVYNQSITLTSGSITPGNFIDIQLPNINMNTHGTYNFTVQITFNPDLNLLNNTLSTSISVNNPDVFISGDTLVCSGNSAFLSANATAFGNVIHESSNSTSYNIPDNIGNGVFSNITLNLPSNIQASSVLEVIIDSLTHTYVGDLKIELYAPNNSYITLVNRKGGNGDNFIKTVFTMSAANSIVNGSAPFTGQFLPEQPFSNLTGAANGTWRLKVMDLAPGDIGAIHKWTIKFIKQNEIVSYIWSDGQIIPNITVTPQSTQTYHVTVTDINGCTSQATFSVTVAGQITNVNLGNDTSLCSGATLVLDAGSGFTHYQWNTGSQSQNIQVTTSGTYWVHATNECGTVGDTIIVTFNNLPNVNLGADTIICPNNTIVLDAGQHYTYIWSNGSTNQTLTFDASQYQQGTYSYSVTVTNVYGCSASDTILITIDQCSNISSLSLSSIRVYPNPANDFIVLENLPLHSFVEIYNDKGKKVYEFYNHNHKKVLDLKDFYYGLYLIKVNTTEPKVLRFIKW